jgi:hypothetical protein
MKKIAFLWILLFILIGPTIGLAQDKISQTGKWKLDIKQSDFGSEPGPRSATLTILTDTPRIYSYRVQGVDEKGESFAVSWGGPEDGMMHPILLNGKPSGQTTGFKREPDGTMIRHSEQPRRLEIGSPH